MDFLINYVLPNTVMFVFLSNVEGFTGWDRTNESYAWSNCIELTFMLMHHFLIT